MTRGIFTEGYFEGALRFSYGDGRVRPKGGELAKQEQREEKLTR